METVIYLVRHGETDWNKESRLQGQKNTSINNLGKIQAQTLAKCLDNEQFKVNAIYSSDLMRAKETAEIVGAKLNLNVSFHSGLRERFFGKLEGTTLKDINDRYPNFNVMDTEQNRLLNIELFDDFKKRVYNAVLDISKKQINRNVVIISHGAAINVFLHKISYSKVGTGVTDIINASISTIIYNHKTSVWKIKEINCAAHIEAI